MNGFLNIFASSPFKLLQQHMDIVYQCTQTLIPFIDKIYTSNWDEALELREKIVALEHEADKLKRELRLHLPKTLFLPVGRSDILELVSAQDKIANKAQDISALVMGRKMRFPAQLIGKYQELLHKAVDATRQAYKVISELDELLSSGFKGKEVRLVTDMIKDLDKIEQETDKLQVLIRAMLFAIEADFSPVDVIFMYKILDWTGDLADVAQQVGHRLQIMLAK